MHTQSDSVSSYDPKGRYVLQRDLTQLLETATTYRPQSPLPTTIRHRNCYKSFNRMGRLQHILHNHPSGDPTPSRADIQMTQQIIAIAHPLGISVHDHIIVGKDGHASFKGLGLIQARGFTAVTREIGRAAENAMS
jgi:hypothetical protein